MRIKFRSASLLTLSLLLTACGGSGGGSAAPSANAGGDPTDPTQPTTPGAPFSAYVVNSNTAGAEGGVHMYRSDANTGQLVGNGFIAAGSRPSAIAVDPAGRHAFVVREGAGMMFAYAIGADARLTKIGEAPLAGSGFHNVSVHPNGRFVYGTNYNGSDVSFYELESATGPLTLRNTYSAGSGASGIAIHPSGQFAYVVNKSGSLSGGGASCDGGKRSLTAYRINGDGTLANNGTYETGTDPYAAVVSPDGRNVYVASWTCSGQPGVVTIHTINADGTLQPGSSEAGTNGQVPKSIAIDPAGRFVYVANAGSGNITAFQRNGATGALTFAGITPSLNNTPEAVAVDATGKFVYAAQYQTGDVGLYTINADGTLAYRATFAANPGSGPLSIALTAP